MRALAAQTAALLTLALTAALNATTTTTTNNPSTLTILPLPRTSEITTTPPTTYVTYHQGLVLGGNSATSSPGPCGGLEVSKGLLTAGYCVELATYAVSVKRMQGLECVFRLFKGSDGCRWDADEMENIAIPSGEGEVCILSQVEDGGEVCAGKWVPSLRVSMRETWSERLKRLVM